MDGRPALLAHCYCGKVTWETSGEKEAVVAGFCHCASCRRAHAAPLYQSVYVPESTFRVTTGAELIKSIGAPIERHFCSRCGTRTHNMLKTSRGTIIGLFPSTFDAPNDPFFRPRGHVHASEALNCMAEMCFKSTSREDNIGLPVLQKAKL